MPSTHLSIQRSAAATDAGSETAQSHQRRDELSPLHTEIERRFGLVPNFFRLAPESPEITANLWGFARFAYLDNPLPSLFKERLFVCLSRFCEVRYCITRHVGFLIGLGRPSGDAESPIQTVEEVIRLIRRPLARAEQLEPYFAQFAADDVSMSELPAPDARLEEAIFACASHVFLQTPEATVCLDALQRVLGESRLQHLLVFLAFVRTAHYWTKTHQELTFEDDLTQLLATHQSLAEYLLKDPEAGACEVSQTLMREVTLLRETEKHHRDLLRAHQALRESEARLRHSELQYRTLTEIVPQVVWMTDAAGHLRYVNQYWERYSGLTLRQLQEGQPGDSLHPDDRERALAAWSKSLDSGEPFSQEQRLRAADGTYRWFLGCGNPVRNEPGEIERWIGIFMDIDDRKRGEDALRESERCFREKIDALPAAVYTTDAEGRLTHFNPAAVEFSGRVPELGTDEWCVSWKLYRADGTLLPHDQCPMAIALKEGRIVRGMEAIAERPDGRRIWFMHYPTPLRDAQGKIVGGINMLVDITERKAFEERLRSFNEELEAQIEDRTRDLLQSQEGLRRLTTELNLLEQRERKRLATELHDHLQQMLVLGKIKLGQGKQLAAAVPAAAKLMKETDDVLTEALQYTRTLVAELSPPVLREHGLAAGLKWLGEYMQKHDLTVTVTVPNKDDLKLPEGQVMLLFQSVRELLINSWKYAKTGQATVRMEQRDDQLHIEVRDQGAGFDLVVAAAGTPSGGISSTYGLFSIQERMRVMGGRFEIDSAPGKGTTATLTLPLAARDERDKRDMRDKQNGISMPVSPLSPLSRVSQSARIRVLLVDDHPMMRQGLRSIVTAYDHLEIVGEANNGAEAVELTRRLKPDVVVMDINMPKMDGIEATHQIKANQPTTVVIGLSVNQSADTEQKMKAAGAFVYLTKESAVDVLCHAIEQAVSYKQHTVTHPVY